MTSRSASLKPTSRSSIRRRCSPRPIVTQVVAFKAFYPAEGYHQDYATLHPDNPYIRYNDLPKVAHLQQQFPNLYQQNIAGH